jgi:ataxin-3
MDGVQNQEENKFVYWEKQGKDRLCGLHALNAIIQGPSFNESNLYAIAEELNKKENDLLDNKGQTDADGTNNVADDGNYNVQVLTEALQNFGEYQLEIFIKPNVISETQSFSEEQGYLCNSADHWFTIRKVHGTWFNLNSTNMDPGPQIVSDFYLDTFMASVANDGYTIFTVRGQDLPLPNKEDNKDSLRKNQFYIGLTYLQQDNATHKRALNTDGADQSDVQEAVRRSMLDAEQNNDYVPHGVNDNDYNAHQHNFNFGGSNGGKTQEELDLEEALRLSMQDQIQPTNPDEAS